MLSGKIIYFYFFLRIIHDNGFSEEDHRRFKPVIFSNTIMSLIAMLRAMEKLRITFQSENRSVRNIYQVLHYHKQLICVASFIFYDLNITTAKN